MTRRHFEAIARIFAARADFDVSTCDFDAGHNTAHESLAGDLADYFETINPHFDRARFLEACGVGN